MFAYVDKGQHHINKGANLVMISIAVFIRDFGDALDSFLESAEHDADLKARIDSRIEKVMHSMPIRK